MTYYKFDDVFERFNYPTGEVHVARKSSVRFMDENDIIEMHCRTAEDVFALSMAADICDVRYFVPYLPFARHDHMRDNADGYPLSPLAKLLEGIKLTIVDPHSDVTANQFDNIPQNRVVDFFRKQDADLDPIFLIPDAGATKKAYTWLKPEDRYIQGMKKRDRATGKLSGFTILYEDLFEQIAGSVIVIVDDICDGGGTFIGLRDALLTTTTGCRPARVELWVTHGMFQDGRFESLQNNFDRILSFKNDGNTHLEGRKSLQLFNFKDLYLD